LFLLPAESAHRLGILALKWVGRSPLLRRRIRARRELFSDLSTTVFGLRYPNPIGLAAGLDKDAVAVEGLFALGFGSIEVGTVTPKAQEGNPPPRLFRLPEHQALINRMGFNNDGAREVAARLARLERRSGPVGVNIGKGRETPLDQAIDDYVRCAEVLAPHADYLVVNASSPNTPGLRQLQEPARLAALLRAVREAVARAADRKPILLKIAPDLDAAAVDLIVDLALETGMDGLVATNTTVHRPVDHPLAREEGGLSGAPLRALSTSVIRRAYARAADRLPIVGVGGIFTGQDAYEKIRAGASLIQLYTGLIFEGPSIVRRIGSDLRALLARDGFQSLAEAVGADVRPSPAALSWSES
jgi:dihydroorotate dehydrogenase